MGTFLSQVSSALLNASRNMIYLSSDYSVSGTSLTKLQTHNYVSFT